MAKLTTSTTNIQDSFLKLSLSPSTLPSVEETDPPLSDLPGPPEEPLQSDCCGTGCSPCVFDIYQEDLEKWRELEKLSPKERKARRNRQAGKIVTPIKVALSTEGYHEFEMVGMKQVTKDSFLYSFGLSKDCTLGVGVGEHMILRVQEADKSYLTRPYTPISDPSQTGFFDILIKLYENGRMSQYIKRWKIGSKTQWRGPFGSFQYIPNQFSHIVMLACGTGIAPMIQVSRAIINNEEDETFIFCIYGNRTQDDILMKEELDHFRTFWNFTVMYTLSKDSLSKSQGKLCYGDRIHFGRIDKELVKKELSSFIPNNGRGKGVVLICGTRSFDKDMINYLSTVEKCYDYFKF